MKQFVKYLACTVFFNIFIIDSVCAFQDAPDEVLNKNSIRISTVKVNPAVIQRVKANGQESELNLLRESLDGKLAAALQKTNKFTVIAGTDIGDVKDEQALGQSHALDQGDKSTAKSGKIAGAKYIVVTTIDNFQDVVRDAYFKEVEIKATRRDLTFSVVVKILDSTSGKSLYTASIISEPLDPVVTINPDFITSQTGGHLTEKAIAELGTRMTQSLANEVVNFLYPAKIIGIQSGQFTINRGEGTGMKAGQIWNVYALGNYEIDPDTGENLGKSQLKIAQIEISEVLPQKSIGHLVGSADGIQIGFIVRQSPPMVNGKIVP